MRRLWAVCAPSICQAEPVRSKDLFDLRYSQDLPWSEIFSSRSQEPLTLTYYHSPSYSSSQHLLWQTINSLSFFVRRFILTFALIPEFNLSVCVCATPNSASQNESDFVVYALRLDRHCLPDNGTKRKPSGRPSIDRPEESCRYCLAATGNFMSPLDESDNLLLNLNFSIFIYTEKEIPCDSNSASSATAAANPVGVLAMSSKPIQVN